jgi:hypothetical protein
MKKIYFKFKFLGLVLSGLSMASHSYGQYRGNNNWATYPDDNAIISEKFQDWGAYKDAEGYGQMAGSGLNPCATGGDFRTAAAQTVSTFNVVRTTTDSKDFVFYLDLCAIQPECDTQSGTMYTLGETGSDNQGPSTTNVSVGAIVIYDNYNSLRPTTSGYLGNGLGSLTTCKIPYLGAVRYTTSSYGRGRGFKLEKGVEVTQNGVTTVQWTTVRQFVGTNSVLNFPVEDWTIPTTWTGQSKEYWYYSNTGWVFEDLIAETDVYLRWSAADSPGTQVVRLHDIRLYGDSPTEIVNPYSYASGINNVSQNNLSILVNGEILTLSENADVDLFDLFGKHLKKVSNVSTISLSFLPKGAVYLVKATSSTGEKVYKKVIL